MQRIAIASTGLRRLLYAGLVALVATATYYASVLPQKLFSLSRAHVAVQDQSMCVDTSVSKNSVLFVGCGGFI